MRRIFPTPVCQPKTISFTDLRRKLFADPVRPSESYVGSDLSDTESDTSHDTSAKDTSRDEDSNKSASGTKKGDILPSSTTSDEPLSSSFTENDAINIE